MRVLLTEGSGLTSRQVAGRLGELGHTVGVLSPDPLGVTRFTKATRAWHACPPFGPDPLVWLDKALEVYTSYEYDVLFPTQEQVTVLSAFPERVAALGVHTAVPPFAALAAVQDKVTARATLERLGLPQPESAVVASADDLVRWTRLPAFVKVPVGTASGGVWRVANGVELGRVALRAAVIDAFAAGEGVLVQLPADGPLAMVQTVFDRGRLVACHANLRARLGARGGASHKTSIAAPEAREVMETLGSHLGWHGALSADVVLAEAGPSVIDVNPRLVEPGNALKAGVDLVGAMLAVIGGESPEPLPAGRTGVATHQLGLAAMGAAEQGRGRRGIATELWQAARHKASYAGSTEELAPVGGDWRAAIPLAMITAATLVRPKAWEWFSSGSVTNYALTPSGWRMICAAAAAD
jgi:glutathione synthase/RimK-type ligase-like ATP-grasp enzyme